MSTEPPKGAVARNTRTARRGGDTVTQIRDPQMTGRYGVKLALARAAARVHRPVAPQHDN